MELKPDKYDIQNLDDSGSQSGFENQRVQIFNGVKTPSFNDYQPLRPFQKVCQAEADEANSSEVHSSAEYYNQWMGPASSEPKSQLQIEIKARAAEAEIQGRNPELFKLIMENLGNQYQCSPRQQNHESKAEALKQNFMRKQYQQQEIIFKVVSDLEFQVIQLEKRHKQDIEKMNQILNSGIVDVQQADPPESKKSVDPQIRDPGSLNFGSKILSHHSGGPDSKVELPSYFDDKLHQIHKDIKKLYMILQDKPPIIAPDLEKLSSSKKPPKIQVCSQIIEMPGIRSKSMDSKQKILMNPYDIEKIQSQLHESRLKNAHQRAQITQLQRENKHLQSQKDNSHLQKQLNKYEIKIEAFHQEHERLVQESIKQSAEVNRFKHLCVNQAQMISQLQQVLTKYQNRSAAGSAGSSLGSSAPDTQGLTQMHMLGHYQLDKAQVYKGRIIQNQEIIQNNNIID